MLMVNIADIKARLSEYLEAVERGEQVIICKRNRPIAELRPIAAPLQAPRDLSPMFPDWKIDAGFFEPLSAGEVAAWEGRAGGELPHVPERAPEYDSARPTGRKRR